MYILGVLNVAGPAESHQRAISDAGVHKGGHALICHAGGNGAPAKPEPVDDVTSTPSTAAAGEADAAQPAESASVSVSAETAEERESEQDAHPEDALVTSVQVRPGTSSDFGPAAARSQLKHRLVSIARHNALVCWPVRS